MDGMTPNNIGWLSAHIVGMFTKPVANSEFV